MTTATKTFPLVTDSSGNKVIEHINLSQFRSTGNAEPSGRSLDSTDPGFAAEMTERGSLTDGRKVDAVYLLTEEQAQREYDNIDWVGALSRFRLIEE